jgi:lipid-A-disaccharide synthase
MEKKYNDITYVFHSTKAHKDLIHSYIKNSNTLNCEVVSDDKLKGHLLKKSIFAIAKSGTVSLEICNAKIPSIIVYKMNLINFLIVKMLVKIKYANIINIAAKEEIIPELLQSKCNSKNIYNEVSKFLDTPSLVEEQVRKTQTILNQFKTSKSPSEQTSEALNKIILK